MQARATVVVSPRERFSYTEQALESIYQNSNIPFDLIYIDGNSPRHIKRYLERESKAKGFKLIRKNHYLRPNEARNLAIPHVQTEYVVFVDNDLLVSPNWLQPLIDCADETRAWIVGPMCLEGQPEDEIIHMFGGEAHFREIQEKRKFFEKHCHAKQKLSKIRSGLQREKTETVEFHCTLARMEAFEKLGPLDEGLKTACEHLDFALLTREAGQEVYVEPTSIVTYVAPPPFTLSDLPFFLWRWSDSASRATIDHFSQKWNISGTEGYSAGILVWCKGHRYIAWKSLKERIHKQFPQRNAVKVVQLADQLTGRLINLI
jgi:glycosyltransferase involved in cell wall biosynthesis